MYKIKVVANILLVVGLFLGAMQINGAVDERDDQAVFNDLYPLESIHLVDESFLLPVAEEGHQLSLMHLQGEEEEGKLNSQSDDLWALGVINGVNEFGEDFFLLSEEDKQQLLLVKSKEMGRQGKEKNEEKKKKRKRLDESNGDQDSTKKMVKKNNGNKRLMQNGESVAYQKVTEDRPYSCESCGKNFGYKHILKRHERRVHTEEALFKCEVEGCFEKYKDREDLVRHKKKHTKEKPYMCNICYKSFRRKNYLKTHNTIHTGKRPFKCTMCEKSFIAKSNLKMHLEKHKI